MGKNIKLKTLTTYTQCKTSLFIKGDFVVATLVALVALTIYFVTLAPSVTLEQSGAFVVAGEHGGIGRAPGYPVWHLLSKVFIKVFGFVHYRGYPNPAWATNFMSAVFGALSCGVVALTVSCVGREIASSKSDRIKPFVAAAAAGMFLATNHTMWSQSVITETHTLSLFCILLFLTACLLWITNPNRTTSFILAGSFGFGIAQSHIVILLAPCLLFALLLVCPRLCREFCIANFFVWIIPCALQRVGLGNVWFTVAFFSTFVLGILLPLRLSAFGGTAIVLLGLIGLGVSFYGYLPIASEGNPPMQFGYARTWEGFKHVVTRGQYERIDPTDVFSFRFLEQLHWYVGLLVKQNVVPFILAAPFSIIFVSRFRGPWLKWWWTCLLALFMLSVVLVIGANPKGDIQDSFIQRVKFIPSFAVWSIYMGLGFLIVLDWKRRAPQTEPENAQESQPSLKQELRLGL